MGTRPLRDSQPPLPRVDSVAPTSLARVSTPPSAVTTPVTRREQLSSVQGAEAVRELDGMKVLLGAMTAFPLVSVPVLEYFTDGNETDRTLAFGSLAVIAVSSLVMFIRTVRNDALPRDAWSASHEIIIALSIPFLTAGLGMCTAFTGIVAVAVLLLCSSAPHNFSVAAFLVIAIGHGTIATMALRGVITTTGLGDVVPTPRGDLLLSALFVEGMYFAAFAIGLVIHRRSSALLAELSSAMRAASERDALLREVREELDRAANQLGPGRFTGHELGSFRVGDVIGRGGMGEVYAATRTEDGSEAAIKLLQRGMLSDREIVRRFEREARAVSAIDTPHVTSVFEVGGPDAPVPYIAMERLRGTDLAAMLRAQGTLPLAEVVELVNEASRGLAVAHGLGLVHRDLKPSNLFRATVGKQDLWKILDFGIAKDTHSHEATLTQNQLVGTPQYMAPEQANGERNIDLRVDVHALTAVAYRALTGRTPFQRDELASVLMAIATEVPVDPRDFVSLSADVTYVLRIGLAKKPSDRFASVVEFASALTDAASEGLSPEVRERARELAKREPWGARLTAAS